SARGREQHLDGRGAVERVVGVHVQVDVDERLCAESSLDRGIVLGDVPARCEVAIDGFERVGGGGPIWDELVVGGEVARHQRGGGGGAGRACVEAAEKALDEAPR